ncbi:septation protein A [Methylobrevis pamukkalensis]|uniref:Inner membrane-spanning protein YciB n=1 Tax=Methylobrevis pamukkalensis TaxID=1439726 RepID=A0A1E3H038_9HYPH|nr:septation protein A [Methylobrevis pamukkalensis]ODN69186.1 Intracellular septation protein [Methylobrevis pamukkalensis]
MKLEKAPNDPTRKAQNPLLKLGLELGPLILFFFVNSRGQSLIDAVPALGVFGQPIFLATAVFMAAMIVALTASWLMTRRLAIMPLVTGAVVLVFGTLTLILQDDTFIKMKPTIVNVLFGATLLIGLAFGKSLVGYVFEDAFRLDAAGWKKLTIRWGLFFLLLAVLNEVVWRTQTTDFWVAFKVWGILPLTLVFSALQLPLLMRHALPESNEQATEEPTDRPDEGKARG